ncbi:MAG: hypothetical protein WCK77_18770 [Verrucomicrobiota bacterium]
MKAIFQFFTIIGTIPVILTLVQRGVLTTSQAAGVMITIMILVTMFKNSPKVVLPLFGFALFITYNVSSNAELKALSGMMLLLVITLSVPFFLLHKVFGKKNN